MHSLNCFQLLHYHYYALTYVHLLLGPGWLLARTGNVDGSQYGVAAINLGEVLRALGLSKLVFGLVVKCFQSIRLLLYVKVSSQIYAQFVPVCFSVRVTEQVAKKGQLQVRRDIRAAAAAPVGGVRALLS